MTLKGSHWVIAGMTVIVIAAAGAGVLLLSDGGAEPGSSAQTTRTATATPTSIVDSASSSPSRAVPLSPTPSRTVKPKPTPKPPQSAVPAPPPLPSEPAGCPPRYEGTNVPRAQVGAALESAAVKRFWAVSQVTLPQNLIKAIAEQESGWQSAIISCVGAIGAMQVLPATADWMNGRFNTSFNVRDVQGNAMLGSQYLQWLIKYLADRYFHGDEGDYALRGSDCAQDPELADYKEWCLLNAVISAYNVGHGTVDRSATDDVAGYFVNHAYLESVRALMNRF